MPNPPLPFLDEKKQDASVSSEHMGTSPGLQAAAHDLMQALKSEDSAAVASALRAAVDCLGSEEGD